jgi:hypothetical protein
MTLYREDSVIRLLVWAAGNYAGIDDNKWKRRAVEDLVERASSPLPGPSLIQPDPNRLAAVYTDLTIPDFTSCDAVSTPRILWTFLTLHLPEPVFISDRRADLLWEACKVVPLSLSDATRALAVLHSADPDQTVVRWGEDLFRKLLRVDQTGGSKGGVELNLALDIYRESKLPQYGEDVALAAICNGTETPCMMALSLHICAASVGGRYVGSATRSRYSDEDYSPPCGQARLPSLPRDDSDMTEAAAEDVEAVEATPTLQRLGFKRHREGESPLARKAHGAWSGRTLV